MSRRSRSRSPRALLAGAAVVVVALVVPLTAGAVTSPFSDVPTDHPFFDEILWMSNTGVTTGFPDGTFRPAQPVTRQAMSAFMQRLYDVQDDMSWQYGTTGPLSNTGTWTDLGAGSVTVKVPDGVYANIAARFTAESSCYGASGYCRIRLLISKDGGPFNEMYPNTGSDYSFDSTSSGSEPQSSWESHALERFAFGDPGGTYQIKVQYSTSNGVPTFWLDEWSLVAETDLQPSDYIPF